MIRAIQTKEGNTACYASKSSGCPYTNCSWMTDCYADAKKAGVGAKGGKKPVYAR
jgi:hypothetical protein